MNLWPLKPFESISIYSALLRHAVEIRFENLIILVFLKSEEYPSRDQNQWSCKMKCRDEKNKFLASPCKNKERSKAFKNANHPYQIRNEKIQVISSARNKNQLSAVPLRNA